MRGCPVRTTVPTVPEGFARLSNQDMTKADANKKRVQEKIKYRWDKGAYNLKKLKIGDRIRLQDPVTKKWDEIYEIIESFRNGRSFKIKDRFGRIKWRNRRFLRPVNKELQEDEDIVMEKRICPRRSPRFISDIKMCEARIGVLHIGGGGGHVGWSPWKWRRTTM